MPTFKSGDSVIFAWCKGLHNKHLIGMRALVLNTGHSDSLVPSEEVVLYVLFENGEKHKFFANRFELVGSEDRLLWKVKQMWERQPYVKGQCHV